MSPASLTYRVYRFDAAHHILTVDLIEAANDEDAVAEAEAAGFGSKFELWQGRRLVATLEAKRREA